MMSRINPALDYRKHGPDTGGNHENTGDYPRQTHIAANPGLRSGVRRGDSSRDPFSELPEESGRSLDAKASRSGSFDRNPAVWHPQRLKRLSFCKPLFTKRPAMWTGGVQF